MVWGKKAGVTDLIEKLRTNTTSETMLVLSNRTFGDTEAKLLAEALAENESLQELLCSGHEISSIGAEQFARALTMNTNLKRLSIGGANFGDEAACALLNDWTNQTLECLDFEYKSLGEPTMNALCNVLTQKLNGIQHLNLARNKIDDAGLESLSKGIKESPHLAYLNLSDNKFGCHGCKMLGDALHSGNARREINGFTLILNENPLIGSAGIEELVSSCLNSSCYSQGIWIESLSLRDCKIDEAGAKILFKAMASPYSFMSQVSELNLGNNSITECSELVDVLHHKTTLKKLSLDFNFLGLQGVLNISSALKANPGSSSLKYLDISANNLNFTEETKEGIVTAMENLVNAKCLKELRLLGNKVGDVGAISLSNALISDDVLQTLSLGAIEMSPEGCEIIMDILSKNNGLRTLEIGSNNIGEKGKLAIEKLESRRPEIDIAVDKSDKN